MFLVQFVERLLQPFRFRIHADEKGANLIDLIFVAFVLLHGEQFADIRGQLGRFRGRRLRYRRLPS